MTPLPLLLVFAAALAQDPIIELTPTSFSLGMPVGGPSPAPLKLTVRNSGEKKMNWTVASSATWLTVSPDKGALNKNQAQELTLTIAGDALAINVYNATVTVSSKEANNSPQTASVRLQVNGVPVLTVSPASLSFSGPLGGPDPGPQTFRVENTGTGTMSWSAATTFPWITLGSSGGNLGPGAGVNVSVSVSVKTFGAGPQAGSVSVTAPGASGTPKSVAVNLMVNQAPSIGLSPSSVTFDAPVNGPNPAPKGFTVTNQGGGTLTWSAASTAPWLIVTVTPLPLVGGASQSVALSVDVTALAADTYSAQVNVTAAGASNTPQSVAVTLNVNGQPVIGLNPTDLTFEGGSGPSAVSVTNAGAGTLHWKLVGGTSWLGASPAQGDLGPGASQPLLVSASKSGLAPGTYRGTLQIKDDAASNSPQTIAVTLNVPTPSSPTDAPAGHCGATGLEALLVLVWARIRRRKC